MDESSTPAVRIDRADAPGVSRAARSLALGLVAATALVAVSLAGVVAFALSTGASLGGGSALDGLAFGLGWLWLLGAPVSTALAWVSARRGGHGAVARAAGALFALWLLTTIWLMGAHR